MRVSRVLLAIHFTGEENANLQEFQLFRFVTVQDGEKLRGRKHFEIDQNHPDGLVLAVLIQHLLNGERLLHLLNTDEPHANGAHAERFEMMRRFFHANLKTPCKRSVL